MIFDNAIRKGISEGVQEGLDKLLPDALRIAFIRGRIFELKRVLHVMDNPERTLDKEKIRNQINALESELQCMDLY